MRHTTGRPTFRRRSPRDNFQALQALILDLVAEGNPDNLSGIDLLADLFGRVREFLEEHDATEDEYRLLVALFLGGFKDLSAAAQEGILLTCAGALGVEIRRTH